MTHKKLRIPSGFLRLFGAPKYEAIMALALDLDLELVSAYIKPLPAFHSVVGWLDSPFSDSIVLKDPFEDVYKSDYNYTQGTLFE